MSINFNKAFGIHETALNLRAKRAEVLANNMANADTPDFKARDIDFSKALLMAQSQTSDSNSLNRTHDKHIDSMSGTEMTDLLYRIPVQPDTGDGNSVDVQVEQAKFAENAMQYQTTLRFLNGKIKGLLLAIKGE
ncbi:MAG: flagellar basal body rod protein FlgB [Gammaproteobacteria bacterium]|nr:flagellar basal body rod protein FlgB [Gammaproteobacteria bacterium]MDH5629572.1 flagellar basal body rod protein FlgB [Gammaproteobacteria bacterium]